MAGKEAQSHTRELTTEPKDGSRIQLRNISTCMESEPTEFAGFWKMLRFISQEPRPTGFSSETQAFIPKAKEKRRPAILYAKGYLGEEVQIDTTEPLQKVIILISAVDDCSRWGMADCYWGNNSQNAANFLFKMVREAPFPIRAVRTDNGSEFKKSFTKACRDLRITIKRNPVKHPTSNGKVERMHRQLKKNVSGGFRPQRRP